MERLYQIAVFNGPFAYNVITGEVAQEYKPVSTYRFFATSPEEAREVAERKYPFPAMIHLTLAP